MHYRWPSVSPRLVPFPTIHKVFYHRTYRAMPPPSTAPATSDSTTTVRETADLMSANLSKALEAVSHDFRSDTVTGSPTQQETSLNGSSYYGDVAEYVYDSNVH